MEENKELVTMKAPDVSDYGLLVEKLFGFGRGIDGTTLATVLPICFRAKITQKS